MEREARHRVFSEVKGYLGKVNLSDTHMLSAPKGQNGHSTNGQQVGVKQRVRAYLDINSELEKLSVNQVLSALKDAGIQAGRTTVAKVLQERKHTE